MEVLCDGRGRWRIGIVMALKRDLRNKCFCMKEETEIFLLLLLHACIYFHTRAGYHTCVLGDISESNNQLKLKQAIQCL